jgi:hypothetical protein
MASPGFGWSAGDVAKLIEVSIVIYQAFNDARKNSSRQFQLLTEEFQRFQMCLELVRDLLEQHNRKLYFGYEQFKATLEDCQDFMNKYAVLGDRSFSFAKIFKTIEWTIDEKSTITRLRTAAHGHAHVINLYVGYMNLCVKLQSPLRDACSDLSRKISLEAGSASKQIMENTQETLKEVKRLRHSSIPLLPHITEEPEASIRQDLRTGAPTKNEEASTLEQVARELDGFSQVLKKEASLVSQHQNEAPIAGPEVMEDEEAVSDDMDALLLQTMLREVERKSQRAWNGSKREYNQHFVRRPIKQNTRDSGISIVSPRSRSNSRQNTMSSTSPKLPARSGNTSRRPSQRATTLDREIPSPDDSQAPLQRQLSTSPLSSPFLGSSPPTSHVGTETNTAATTPIFVSPAWNPVTGTRPPSLVLPAAAAEWSLFCKDAQVTCKGWQEPWSCQISQRRRTRDGGLSLRAEKTDGSFLYHDLPAAGMAIPHTSHTGPNPVVANVVNFKEPNGHRLRKVTKLGEGPEMEPRYFFPDALDHKAFQEVIYGCKLVDSWDIDSIESDREKESVTQTLRLWKDVHAGMLVILFYTNNRKRSPKTYVQEPSKLPLVHSLNSCG